MFSELTSSFFSLVWWTDEKTREAEILSGEDDTLWCVETVFLINKTEYITKCEALLQDLSVSQHLSKATSPTIHKELIKILQDYKNNNFISETEYTQLRPHGSISPAARFYGLPKLYKTNMPMCPIVSACGTATYNTAKFNTKILQNDCGKTSSFVKDSIDFIKKFKHLSINPEE